VAVYKRHFGSLGHAYARIGYKQSNSYRRFNWPLTRHLLSVSKSVRHRLIEAIWERGGRAKQSARGSIIKIDGKLTVAIAVARYVPPAVQLREKWVASCDRMLRRDYTVIVRMDRENKDIVDYFFMPESEVGRQRTVIREGNFAEREPYRCTSFTMLLNRVLSKTPILSATGRSPWRARARVVTGGHG